MHATTVAATPDIIPAPRSISGLCLATLTPIFAAVLGIAFIIFMKVKSYYKSEQYLEKERSRKTKLKDVQKLAKENNLSPLETNILWEICRITDTNNILYSIKSNNEVNELFHTAYDLMKQQNLFNEEKLASSSNSAP